MIFLAGLLALPACSGGAKGPSSTVPDASTSPNAATDGSADDTVSAGEENGNAADGTSEEASPEIVMHVIKTVLQ